MITNYVHVGLRATYKYHHCSVDQKKKRRKEGGEEVDLASEVR